MNNKPLSYTDLMNFKYNDVFKQRYASYYRQEPDGTLTPVERQICFDFSDKSKRIRFFADPESGLCVRLAEIGNNLENVCFAAQRNFATRLADGREPKDVVSTEDCRDKDGEGFSYDSPDTETDVVGESEQNAFDEWIESQLSVEERGLYRAVKAGYTANEYAKLMERKHSNLQPNSVWRKYDRLLNKLLPKVEKLRAEWDAI